MGSGEIKSINISHEPEVSESQLWLHIASSQIPLLPNYSTNTVSTPCSDCVHALHLGGDFKKLVCVKHLDIHLPKEGRVCSEFVSVLNTKGNQYSQIT